MELGEEERGMGNDEKINRSLDCHSARSFSHPSPPSSLRPSETDTTPPFSGRPGGFCRHGCFGPAIIRLSVGSMTSCGQRSVVAPAPIAR